jgi:O-antigen ligase
MDAAFENRSARRTLRYASWATGAGLVAAVVAVVASIISPGIAMLLVIGVSAPVLALITGNPRKLLLAMVAIDIPLQLDTYIGYEELLPPGIIGYNFSVTTIALIGLAIMHVVRTATDPGGRRPLMTGELLRFATPAAVYLAFQASTLFWAYDAGRVTWEVVRNIQILALMLYVAGTFRDRDDILFFFKMLILAMALEGLIMLALYFYGRDFRFGGIRFDATYGGNRELRVSGTIGSPIEAAGYLALLLGPTIGAVFGARTTRERMLPVAALLLGLIGMITTLSRGGLITFALSMMIFLPLAVRRGWISAKPLIAAGVVVLVLGGVFSGTIIERFLGDDNGSASARGPLNQLAWNMIVDHPFTGVGANNFGLVTKDYLTPDFNGAWIALVHNRFMLAWAETGTVGLILFAFVLLNIYRYGWLAFRASDDPQLGLIALGFLASTMAQVLHMSWDTFNGRPQMQTLYVAAAMLFAIWQYGRRKQEAERLVIK